VRSEVKFGGFRAALELQREREWRMSMVRFATKCDKCGRRSEEYTSWPSCKDCGEDICPDCDIDSERTEDESNKTLCLDCRIARAQDEPKIILEDR
jgi:hypothetical protein